MANLPIASGAGATLTKTLTYGAALNARQPVHMQSDGKVYPMIGGGGSLISGASSAWFGGVTNEAMFVAPIPGVANRFLHGVIYTDGVLYTGYHDVNPSTGAVAFTQNSNQSGHAAGHITEGAAFAISPNGLKGLLLYQTDGSTLRYYPGNTTTTGYSPTGNANVAASSASPSVVPTTSNVKFLTGHRTVSQFVINMAEVSAASPVVTTLTAVSVGTASVKSGFLTVLNAATDAYVYVNATSGNLNVQPFTFNTTSNAVNLLGGANVPFTVNPGTYALNYSVIYRDATEVWIAVQRDGDPNNITMLKILLASGNVTSFAPQQFTANSISLPLNTVIHGHRTDNGKFLVQWVTGTSTVNAAEYILNRTNGTFAVSLSAVSLYTASATITQGRSNGDRAVGVGYGVKSYNFQSNALVASGTFQSAASPYSLIGINQSSGALNSSGIVHLRGSIQAGHTGLAPGSIYYADLATGGITTSPASGIIAGRAVSTTELQIAN
jgi:hypothetical protein